MARVQPICHGHNTTIRKTGALLVGKLRNGGLFAMYGERWECYTGHTVYAGFGAPIYEGEPSFPRNRRLEALRSTGAFDSGEWVEIDA